MTLDKKQHSIGFIGLGIMGNSMARHILSADWPIHVYNRTKAKADDLVGRGAVWMDTPGEVASQSDVIITMLGYPHDVEEVYLGPGGLVERARDGAYLIDMTTSSPSLAQKIADAASARGLRALDAPVSGGDVGAREAKLAIMMGGGEEDFKTVLPLMELMGTNIRHLGGPGAGQHTKMANQVVIASTLVGVCEGLSYAKKVGLDPKQVLETIGTGAAGSFQLNVLGPRMLDGAFDPGFYAHHFMKDMDIALTESGEIGFDLPGVKMVRGMFEDFKNEFGTDFGTQALFKLYDR